MKNMRLFLVTIAVWAGCSLPFVLHAQTRNFDKPDFRAEFIIPLSSGRENGEREILDAELVSRVNIEILKPVIRQVVTDAYNGKIPAYSDRESRKHHKKRSYVQEMTVLALGGGEVDIEDLLVSIQIGYKGYCLKNSNKLQPEFLDIVWVDETQIVPDCFVGRVKLKDLKRYEVVGSEGTSSLISFLSEGGYERYPIRVETPTDKVVIETHQQALQIRQVLFFGDVTTLKSH